MKFYLRKFQQSNVRDNFTRCWVDIEDLKLVFILYKINETNLLVSLINFKMNMSVRFCLSYDYFKWDFIALKLK